MASSPKILLVLFEGLADTVIESQVLLHAREMAQLGSAEFEIWAVACSEPLYRRSLSAAAGAQALANCPVTVLRGVRPAFPFSTLINALRLGWRLATHPTRFEIIHARTDYSVAVCAFLKWVRRFILIWDCRGDSVAEFAERFQARTAIWRLARAIKIKQLERQRRRAARVCDRAIFVTAQLRELAAPYLGAKPYAIIPGAASDALFGFDPALRAETRRELGLGAEVRLYVYSGSLAPYQCFDETVALYARIRARDPGARFLVLTPALAAARHRIDAAGAADVMLHKAAIGEVSRYLNAADAAFMLRAPTAVNRVAFPTKFAEYCLVGLPVLTTSAVPAAYETARELGNLIEPPSQIDIAQGDITWPAGYDRSRVAASARARLSRGSLAQHYADIYRLKTARADRRGAKEDLLVALLIPSLGPGGAERAMIGLANDLVARGSKVALLTLAAADVMPFYPLAPQVDRIYLDALGGQGLFDRVQRILGRLWSIRRAVRKFRPDVALSFMDTMNVTAIWALLGTGVPLIVSERVDPLPHRHRLGPIRNLLRNLSYPLARRIVVQTAMVRDHCGYWVRRKAVILPNAITPVSRAAAPAAPVDGRFSLIGVGRLDPQKGFDLAIAAFAQLAPEFPDWDMVIWGEGTERPQLEAQIEASGLKDRIRLPGLTRDITRELLNAHALVFPSRYEGFPNAVGEAMACGLPAVAFVGTSGVEDLIEHNVTGLLVSRASPVTSIKEALERIMRDDNLRVRMGTRARSRIPAWEPSYVHGMWLELLRADIATDLA